MKTIIADIYARKKVFLKRLNLMYPYTASRIEKDLINDLIGSMDVLRDIWISNEDVKNIMTRTR